MTTTASQRIDRCLVRMDILIAGLRRLNDERKDQTDLQRTPCSSCGDFTRFDVCPHCFTARLRREYFPATIEPQNQNPL